MRNERAWVSSILWVGILTALTYYLLPTLTRSHVEGFTYLTETKSLLAPAFEASDPIWQMNSRFFYLTRPGVIWTMAPLSNFMPGTGYNFLMWLSLPVLLAGLVYFTRSLGKSSWLSCVTAIIFLPILVEASFFYNDNYVALSLSVLGLVILIRFNSMYGYLIAGILFYVAILFRLDQVLIGPIFFITALIMNINLKETLKRVLALCVGVTAAYMTTFYIDPTAANLLARIEVVSAGDALWDRNNASLKTLFIRDARAAANSMGVGIPVVMMGVLAMTLNSINAISSNYSKNERKQNLILLIFISIYLPAIYIITFGKNYDPRSYLTSMPLLMILASHGIDHFIFFRRLSKSQLNSSWSLARKVLSLALVAPLLVPAIKAPGESENAAPFVFGRIWFGAEWQAWQDGFRQREADAEDLIRTARDESAQSVVLTWRWTEDRRFQNRLAVEGFSPDAVNIPTCKDFTEAWTDTEGTTIYLLRMHVPFLKTVALNSAAAYFAHGSQCLSSFPENNRYWFGDNAGLTWTETVSLQTGSSDRWRAVSNDNISELNSLAEDYIIKYGNIIDKSTNNSMEKSKKWISDINLKLNP